MLQKLRLHNAKKNRRVIVAKDIIPGRGFQNKFIVRQDSRGDIVSDGFEQGMVKVKFYTHATGTQLLEFNELSAANFLLIDVY